MGVMKTDKACISCGKELKKRPGRNGLLPRMQGKAQERTSG